jgi:hypothetical protein
MNSEIQAMAEPKIGVLLTEEGARALELPFATFIRRSAFGHYFNCTSIDFAGPFLSMEVEANENSPEMGTSELQIPLYFVRATIRNETRNPIGFLDAGDDDFTAKRDDHPFLS